MALSTIVATTIPPILPAHGAGTPTLLVSPATMPLAPQNTQVTFNISVANMPAFSSWDISVKVGDDSVLNPATINLIENFGGTASVFANCVDGGGSGCGSNDGAGVAHSAVASLGASDTGNVTLFSVTFNSLAPTGSPSYTFVTILSPNQVSQVSDPSGNPIPVDAVGATYGQTASAPVADFSWRPVNPYQGDTVTLNGTLSYDPSGGSITTYYWTCQCPHLPIVTLSFSSSGNQSISLTVVDNKGLRSATKTHLIEVRQRIIFDLKMGELDISQYNFIIPGTLVKLSATVANDGNLPVGSFNVTVKTGDVLLGVGRYNATQSGNLTIGQLYTSHYTWDTTGFKPGSYSVSATVSTLPLDNYTLDKTITIDVRLIEPIGATLIPFTAAVLGGIVVAVIVLFGVVVYQLNKKRARRRRLLQDAL